MDRIFYFAFIKLYPFVAKLISPFNNKAALWVNGRRNLLEEIAGKLKNDPSKKIWFHCASLGEFEQGSPVLQKLRLLYPSYKFVLTFFSPSGYEPKKNSGVADYIFYMPVDSVSNAKKFLDIIQPSLIIFIKYEYWYYYLKEAHKRKIPLFLASGIFLPNFSFFKWYGKMRREMLTFFTHFFVQTKNSKELLQTINIKNVTVTGDTRFDRVLEVANEQKDFPEIVQFIDNKKSIVAGSTWTDDDEALDHFVNSHPQMRFIIAPHDVGKSRISECKELYHFSILYSEYKLLFEKNEILPAHITTIIIDNIGMLKFLYRYATVCYVGGGFGKNGIHNILEAAVYYKPIVFGPEYENFYEAISLIEKGAAFDVDDALELEKQFEDLLTDEKFYNEACTIAGEYVQHNAGATNAIINYFQENRLLTN